MAFGYFSVSVWSVHGVEKFKFWIPNAPLEKYKMFWVKFQNVVVSQDVYNTTENVNYMNKFQKDKTMFEKQNITPKFCYRIR